jgi:hypothetical protein
MVPLCSARRTVPVENPIMFGRQSYPRSNLKASPQFHSLGGFVAGGHHELRQVELVYHLLDNPPHSRTMARGFDASIAV